MSRSNRLHLNIAGQRYEILAAVAAKYPETRLGQLARSSAVEQKRALCDDYSESSDEYFFNRCPFTFRTILQYHLSGEIHAAPADAGVCRTMLADELRYWGIFQRADSDKAVDKLTGLEQLPFCTACSDNSIFYSVPNSSRTDGGGTSGEGASLSQLASYGALARTSSTKLQSNAVRDNRPTDNTLSIEHDAVTVLNNGPTAVQENCAPNRLQEIKTATIGDVTTSVDSAHERNDRQAENETSTPKNQEEKHTKPLLQLVTIVIILLNVTLIVMDSIKAYHWSTDDSVACSTESNQTTTSGAPAATNCTIPSQIHHTQVAASSGENSESLLGTKAKAAMRTLDWICTIWFTGEWAFRFWKAPDRWKFFINLQSLIDLLAIGPTYIEAIVHLTAGDSGSSLRGLAMLKIMRIFRVFRIFRILKLARYESSFLLIADCIKESYPELSLLFVYLIISTLLFGSLIYYSESDEADTRYSSIPMAVWWAIVTHFCFADAPPRSFWGKLVAALAAIWGVVFMAFPIGILVERFTDFFSRHKFVRAPKQQQQQQQQQQQADVPYAALQRLIMDMDVKTKLLADTSSEQEQQQQQNTADADPAKVDIIRVDDDKHRVELNHKAVSTV